MDNSKDLSSFDIETILMELSKERPVFHNESDFQFSLALKIKKLYSDDNFDVRLEKFYKKEIEVVKGRRRTKRKYIDIVVSHRPTKKYIAIELKYKTLDAVIKLRHKIENKSIELISEQYDLQKHIAQDYGCYSVLADVSRIEKLRSFENFLPGYTFEKGYAVLISNDRCYEKQDSRSIFRNYWLCNSEEENKPIKYKKGTLTFVTNGVPKEETCAKGYDEIVLEDEYFLKWKQYSNVALSSAENLVYPYDETEVPSHKRKRDAFEKRRDFRCLIININKKDN